MKKAIVFPGQGAQFKGMGKGYFNHQPMVEKADDILGYSIKDLCLSDPNGKLRQTNFTQPAVFVVNALMYQRHLEEPGPKPSFFAGHSLGEYNALWAAGAFTFETGLQLVKKRGELMAMAKDGGMAAVMGLSSEKINALLAEENIDTIETANINTTSQVVVSGLKETILRSKEVFLKRGASHYIPLPVGGAFHSKYMKPAFEEFRSFLQAMDIQDPGIDVIANVTGLPYSAGTVKDILSDQVISSVKWLTSILYLLNQGVEDIKEVGPGRTLTNMITDIKRKSQLVTAN